MLLSQGRYWRASLARGAIGLELRRASLPDELQELRDLQIDVPLEKWNLVVKRIHADRKLLGGLLLDFARHKDRVGGAVSSDRLLAELRRQDVTRDVGVILLTARREEPDRIKGLSLGADDYLAKPFSPQELVLRVGAVLRRLASPAVAASGRLAAGPIALDQSAHRVHVNGDEIELTATEFQLLTAMARHPGRVFTRTQLLDAVRGEEVDAFDRAIDAHVKNIRRKIEIDPRRPRYLLTVYGVGYKCAEL